MNLRRGASARCLLGLVVSPAAHCAQGKQAEFW